MAAQLRAEYADESEDLESSSNIVKFAVVKKTEPDHAQRAGLASFEEAMLPHLDAAHNLARWLLRNEQDAQDVVQEAYLRAFKSFAGFRGSNGRAWLLTIVRNTSYTLLKKNRAVDLTTTFEEDIHAPSQESASPATILEHAEDAELMRNAMEKLPAEFRCSSAANPGLPRSTSVVSSPRRTSSMARSSARSGSSDRRGWHTSA